MRDNRIDVIKGLAIIFVLIMHSLTPPYLMSIYRVFHIGQAVPLFMLISGYVFTLSYKNSGITALKDCYNINILKMRIKRLYIPFLVIYFLEICLYEAAYYKVFHSYHLSPSYIIEHLITGGFGAGTYYPVIMFQFLFVIPIIYIVSYKKLNSSIPVFFAVGILFELFAYLSGMSEDTYRIFIGRYIFVIALGSYFALNQNKMNKKLLYIGAILGAVYMYASLYLDYNIFGHDFWKPYQAPAYFYTALLFVTGMNVIPEKIGSVLSTIAEFGKASWHIFLIQMFYFWQFPVQSDNIFIFTVSLIICITFGYLFYMLESNIRDRRVLHEKAEINGWKLRS